MSARRRTAVGRDGRERGLRRAGGVDGSGSRQGRSWVWTTVRGARAGFAMVMGGSGSGRGRGRGWLGPWSGAAGDENGWCRWRSSRDRGDPMTLGGGRGRARPQSVRLFWPRPLAIGAYGQGWCHRPWTWPGWVSNGLGRPWAGLALGVRRYLPLGWLRVGTAGSPQLPVPLSRPPRPLPTFPPVRARAKDICTSRDHQDKTARRSVEDLKAQASENNRNTLKTCGCCQGKGADIFVKI